MASTRNKNTESNYRLEMQQYRNNENYTLYPHSSHGVASETRWAGNGLLPGQIPLTQLSNNGIDLESFLFGIGSTNLVDITSSMPSSACATVSITPDLKTLSNFNIYSSRSVIMPSPMRHNPNERPFCIPK